MEGHPCLASDRLAGLTYLPSACNEHVLGPSEANLKHGEPFTLQMDSSPHTVGHRSKLKFTLADRSVSDSNTGPHPSQLSASSAESGSKDRFVGYSLMWAECCYSVSQDCWQNHSGGDMHPHDCGENTTDCSDQTD